MTQKNVATPAELLFGRNLRLPIDLLYGRPEDEYIADTEYVIKLSNQIERVHHHAGQNIRVATDRMKHYYDTGSNSQTLEPGQHVWLHNPKRKKGVSPKLSRSWEGSYTVTERLNDVLYCIQQSPRAKQKVVHRNRLWKCSSNQTPKSKQGCTEAESGHHVSCSDFTFTGRFSRFAFTFHLHVPSSYSRFKVTFQDSCLDSCIRVILILALVLRCRSVRGLQPSNLAFPPSQCSQLAERTLSWVWLRRHRKL